MFAPMNIVVRPLDNRVLDELVETRRALSGNRIIARRKPRENSKEPACGEAVGILIDQNTTLDQGVFIDFLRNESLRGNGVS
jgi:KDO2-lipid IV(A) lauroyltransferase